MSAKEAESMDNLTHVFVVLGVFECVLASVLIPVAAPSCCWKPCSKLSTAGCKASRHELTVSSEIACVLTSLTQLLPEMQYIGR